MKMWIILQALVVACFWLYCK